MKVNSDICEREFDSVMFQPRNQTVSHSVTAIQPASQPANIKSDLTKELKQIIQQQYAAPGLKNRASQPACMHGAVIYAKCVLDYCASLLLALRSIIVVTKCPAIQIISQPIQSSQSIYGIEAPLMSTTVKNRSENTPLSFRIKYCQKQITIATDSPSYVFCCFVFFSIFFLFECYVVLCVFVLILI